MKTKEEVLIKLGEQTKKVNVDLALVDDLSKAEKELKNALLSFGEVEKQYLSAKKKLATERDSAYDIAIKYNFAVKDLGFDPMKNVAYSTIDKYLQSPIVKGA